MTAHPSYRILVIEAISGGALLTRAALDSGMSVVVASADTEDRIMPVELRERIDELIAVETNDHEALVEQVSLLHKRSPIDAVFPGCDVYVPAAARVAAELGLPGLDVRTVDRVRDKARMREAIAAAGLSTARAVEVDGVEQLPAAAAVTGFPCVVKPVDQSGSLHVTRVDDLAGLTAAYTAMTGDDLLDLGRPMGRRAMVEEYLDGPEYSVEGYVLDGRVRVVAVTEKILGPEPHFAELGHVVPAVLSSRLGREIQAYVEQVAGAVGVSIGPFHCELRVTEQGPTLVEIGARMGGDRIADLVELACGVSLPRVWLAAHLGLDPAALGAFPDPVASFAAIQFLSAPQESSFVGATGLDEVRALEGVREAQLDARPGDPLYPLEDFRCRIGHALFVAPTRAVVTQLQKAIGETIRINPGDGDHG